MAHIQLEKVSVDFPIFGAAKNLRLSLLGGLTGGRILPRSIQTKAVVVKALDEITMDLRSGDRIGLIGHNGAGKSTLLRVLAGVYQPTSGLIRAEGRITPLLNQSPGVELEDSGYENIITIGLLLGMTIDEITAKVDEIIEFSGLGDYIHLPVRRYSSGMQARLGFSICTALEPGILLLDEGIGTADAQFAEKAAARVTKMVEQTEILILASHSDTMISSMCDRAALIHHGRLIELGAVPAVMKSYQKLIGS